MLKKETLSQFKKLSGISDSAIIQYPITNFNPADKSILAFLNLEELGEEPFEKFGIYKISEFLQLLDFYSDAEINLDGNVITIKNDITTQRYITTNENNLKSFEVSSAIISKIEQSPLIGNINLTSDDIERIKKISNLLSLSELGISSTESEIVFTIQADSSQFNTQTQNDNKTIMSGGATEAFELKIKMDSIQKLPVCDYTIEIHKNENSGSYITQWDAVDSPLQIVVMPKAN